MSCEHESKRAEWINMQNGIMMLHPFCERCGTFKNISSDRGMKLEYFISRLTKIKNVLRCMGYKVSEAQIRLIIKELAEMDGFSDTWWITYTKQKEIFVSVVKKYINVSKSFIESFV